MKTCDFKNFFNNLKADPNTYESFGFAFIDLTEKQIVKVIEFYKEIGECEKIEKNGKEWLNFGLKRFYVFPVERYNAIK